MKKYALILALALTACAHTETKRATAAPAPSPAPQAKPALAPGVHVGYFGTGACFDKKKNFLFSAPITTMSETPCTAKEKGPCYQLQIPKDVDGKKIKSCKLNLAK